jgi:DNA-binding transcriptional ArsR family regulator
VTATRVIPGGRIERPATIALLASPLRQELVDTLQALGGEASVAELAVQLGRPADGLYYHLRLLARGGLLAERSGRSRAGRGERRYRIAVAPGSRLRLVYRPADRANRAAVARVAGGMLRIAGRDFRAALATPGVVTAGPRRELWASRNQGWVSGADLAEINRMLTRVQQLLDRPRARGRGRLVGLCFVLAPLRVSPARRGGARSRSSGR